MAGMPCLWRCTARLLCTSDGEDAVATSYQLHCICVVDRHGSPTARTPSPHPISCIAFALLKGTVLRRRGRRRHLLSVVMGCFPKARCRGHTRWGMELTLVLGTATISQFRGAKNEVEQHCIYGGASDDVFSFFNEKRLCDIVYLTSSIIVSSVFTQSSRLAFVGQSGGNRHINT